MKSSGRAFAFLCFSFLLVSFLCSSWILVPSCFAEVKIVKIEWQVARGKRKRGKESPRYAAISSWPQSPGQVSPGRLRIMATLVNTSSAAVEGVLLRYSVSAYLIPVALSAREGVWGVPFRLEQTRIPKIRGHGRVKKKALFVTNFQAYLKQLGEAGFWPKRLKVRVMIVPKRGDESIEMGESLLEIVWGNKRPESLTPAPGAPGALLREK